LLFYTLHLYPLLYIDYYTVNEVMGYTLVYHQKSSW